MIAGGVKMRGHGRSGVTKMNSTSKRSIGRG